jgi:signal peptidase II
MHHVQRSRRVPPLGLAHPGRVFAATASAFLIGDQIAKAVARSSLQLAEPVPFIPGFIRLVLVHNTGAAFGLFQGGRPVFVLTTLFVIFAIAAYWRRVRPTEWPVVIALGMIAGGSLGNLIDRAVVGQVTDFFDFMFIDFPVFNVADIGIVGGVALLMMWVLFGPQPGEDVDAVAEPTETTEPAVCPPETPLEASADAAALEADAPVEAPVDELPAVAGVPPVDTPSGAVQR